MNEGYFLATFKKYRFIQVIMFPQTLFHVVTGYCTYYMYQGSPGVAACNDIHVALQSQTLKRKGLDLPPLEESEYVTM